MYQQQTQRQPYNNHLQQLSSTCDSTPTHSSSNTTTGNTAPISSNIQADITSTNANHPSSSSIIDSLSSPPKPASVSLHSPHSNCSSPHSVSSPSPAPRKPSKMSPSTSATTSSSTVNKLATNSTSTQQQQQRPQTTVPIYSQLSVLEREDDSDSDSDTDNTRLSIVDAGNINNDPAQLHSYNSSAHNLIASHNATTSTSDIHKNCDNNTIHISNNNSNKIKSKKSTDRSSTPVNHKRQYQQQEATISTITTDMDTETDAKTALSTDANTVPSNDNNSVIITSDNNDNNSNKTCTTPATKLIVKANNFGSATLTTSVRCPRKSSRQDSHNRSKQAPIGNGNNASTNMESNGNDNNNSNNGNDNNNTTTNQRKHSCQSATKTGIKISVVGSPEVFGHLSGSLSSSSAAVRATTPDSEDERIIERYDLVNASPIPPHLSSSSFFTISNASQLNPPPPILYPSISLTETNARANPQNPTNFHELPPTDHMSSISDFRPPKKRFAEIPSEFKSSSSCTSQATTSLPSALNRRQFMQNPFVNQNSSTQRHYQQQPQTSAFVEPNRSTPCFIPSNDQFQEAMNHWDWYQIDNFIMPVVLRANQRYAAVQIVQLKLLSKFPPNIPTEMTAKFIMVSYKMSAIEAWILNSINAVITKFDLGCHLFTPNDEIVRVDDVERFYWSVKEWNMKAMIERYNTELRDTSSTHLMALITKIRNSVQESIQEMERTSEFLQSNNSTENVANLTAQTKLRSKLP